MKIHVMRGRNRSHKVKRFGLERVCQEVAIDDRRSRGCLCRLPKDRRIGVNAHNGRHFRYQLLQQGSLATADVQSASCARSNLPQHDAVIVRVVVPPPPHPQRGKNHRIDPNDP